MSSARRHQAIAIVLLLLIIVGSVFIVVPLRERVQELKAQREIDAASLQAEQTEYDELSTLSKEISQSEAKQNDLMEAVPVGTEQDAFILELSSLVEEVDFDLRAMNFSERNDDEYGKSLNISLNLQGSYSALIDFLQSLEAADRLVKVNSISVQRTSTTDMSFSLSLDAYYQ